MEIGFFCLDLDQFVFWLVYGCQMFVEIIVGIDVIDIVEFMYVWFGNMIVDNCVFV